MNNNNRSPKIAAKPGYSWDSNLVKLQGLYSQPLGLYWRLKWQPTLVFWRILRMAGAPGHAGLWGRMQSDTTEAT